MIAKTLVILLLIAAIFGGVSYSVYELYLKPKQLDIQEKETLAVPAPAPPPDPSLAAFDLLKPTIEANTPEMQSALSQFLSSYPESPMASNARAVLGRINALQLLSPIPSPDKTAYVVVSGDSLSKISGKTKVGAELLYRANGLSTINLKIGQQLLIPQIKTQLVINSEASTLTVNNGDIFFREYPIRSLKLPAAVQGKMEAKVADRVAMKDSKRVAFGTKDYDTSEKFVILDASGITIRAMPAALPDGTLPPAPLGIGVDPSDAEEIFVLTTRGTPVSIR